MHTLLTDSKWYASISMQLHFVLCHILQRCSVLLNTERKLKILVVITDYPHQD